MSNKGTKKTSAAEAASKAEEAIRNAEMLEKIARDAVDAAAQAREQAEQAKALAKDATKKKEVVESIKKVSKAAESQTVDRKFILDYLQKNAWDLQKRLDNVYDIRFEDDPPRVVMEVVPGPNGPESIQKPKLMHNGVEIEVELEFRTPGPVTVAENEEGKTIVTQDEQPDKEADEVYHRSITGQGAKALGVTEALGPHSMDKAAKQREAYQAWLKRHPGVKVHKGE